MFKMGIPSGSAVPVFDIGWQNAPDCGQVRYRFGRCAKHESSSLLTEIWMHLSEHPERGYRDQHEVSFLAETAKCDSLHNALA